MFGLWFPVSSACPSLLSQLLGFPCAPRPAGAGGEQFLAAAASCRPHGVQCPIGHSGLTVPCPQPAFGTGWEPHRSAGYCPSDDLGGCPGTSRDSHGKRGRGFILWKPFQLPKGASSALPLRSASIVSAPRKGRASSTALGPRGPCPTRCFAGRCPEKGGGWKRAADSREAPGIGPLVEAAAGLCVPSSAGGSLLCNEPRRPLPACPVTFSHTCCCCLAVLFPWSPMVWGRKVGHE